MKVSSLREPLSAVDEGDAEEGLGLSVGEATGPGDAAFTVGAGARAFVFAIEDGPTLAGNYKKGLAYKIEEMGVMADQSKYSSWVLLHEASWTKD